MTGGANILAIRLPDEIKKRLESLAVKTGRTKSFYAKEAILTHLEDIEDYYLAVHRIENPPEKIWSLKDLEKGCDLEG